MKKTLYVLWCALCALLVLPAAAQVPSYVPTDGLEGWWSFSGNANDGSENQNNGTVDNLSYDVDRYGNSNGSIYLDGVGNNSILTNPFFQGAQVPSFTLHAVINYSLPNNGMCIWGKTLFWGEVSFGITNTNGIYCFWANSITGNRYSSIASSTAILMPDTWYTIDMVYQNSTAQLYLNGLPIGTELTWGNQGGGLVSNTQLEAFCNFDTDVNSSMFGEFAGTTFYKGLIDEFGIWSTPLTSEVVFDMYMAEPIISSSSCSSLPSNLQQGLVGYWPFCGNANDESGNGNDGVVNGATLTEDRFGNAGSAYDFNDNTIDVGASPELNIAEAGFTVSVWANKIGGSDQWHILGKREQCGDFHYQISSNDLPYGLAWGGWSDQNSFLQTGLILPNGDWNHIAGTFDGFIWRLYLNSVMIDSLVSDIPSSVNANLLFGKSGTCQSFHGSLDDIGIWNRALTPEEVQELYTLDACTFTVYDTLTVYETVYDTVYTYETIYDTATTYVTVTDTLLIDITFTGFEGQPSWLNTVTVFPNPASDYITIDYGNFTLMTGYNTIITNAAGATVYQGVVNSQQTTIDINAWGSTGVYYMSIYDANGELVAVRHIVLE